MDPLRISLNRLRLVLHKQYILAVEGFRDLQPFEICLNKKRCTISETFLKCRWQNANKKQKSNFFSSSFQSKALAVILDREYLFLPIFYFFSKSWYFWMTSKTVIRMLLNRLLLSSFLEWWVMSVMGWFILKRDMVQVKILLIMLLFSDYKWEI